MLPVFVTVPMPPWILTPSSPPTIEPVLVTLPPRHSHMIGWGRILPYAVGVASINALGFIRRRDRPQG